MLEEFVLIPDVFDPAAYSNPAFIEMCLPHLKEPLLHEALVRDLHDGGWSRYCIENSEKMHRLCREIVRKLEQSNRLRRFPAQTEAIPATASEWCNEALTGHAKTAFRGVIAGHATKQLFDKNAEVASIEKLTGTTWWQRRSPSITLDRKTAAYQQALLPVFVQARSLMFIDPNLDPSEYNYREFGKLFGASLKRAPSPRLEFHRSFCKGDGPARKFPTEDDWKKAFMPLGQALRELGMTAEVFFWDDFHARFLISDVVGMNMEAGFDVTTKPDDMTVWNRLGREDKDWWQRQFDPGPMATKLKWRFAI